jgi:predicted phosphoadenosine phosphosulfate sulfurtransferase
MRLEILHQDGGNGYQMGQSILKKKRVDVDVLTLALERMENVYRQFDSVVCSFSGGKDSTVIFHVCLEVARSLNKLPLKVVFIDEEAIPQDTEDYVRRVFARADIEGHYFCSPVKHRNACSRKQPWWFCWSPEDEPKWCRPYPDIGKPIPNFPVAVENRPAIPDCNDLLVPYQEHGNTALILGIRASESLSRFRAVSRRSHENYLVIDRMSQGHITKAYPAYDFTTTDVWHLIRKTKSDYNRAYDVMNMLGISPHNQRCAPPYGQEPMQRLWIYKHAWPELWDRMVNRVDGANCGMMYGRTDIYSFGAFTYPKDLDWKRLVREEISKHPRDIQQIIIRRIRSEIARHYKKCDSPILSVPNPDSGLCWRLLLSLAKMADLKHRHQAGFRAFPAGSQQYESMRQTYETEYKRLDISNA